METSNSSSRIGGKDIIITGASRGFGYAIAEIFAENGNDLLLTSMNEDRLLQAVGELQTRYRGISIKAKPFDLSKKEQAQAFGQWCLRNGSPEVLRDQMSAMRRMAPLKK